MTSMAMTGRRCQLKRAVTSVAGRFERDAEGRVRYASENVGRLLFVVDWNVGGSSVVFPDELDFLDETA